MVRRKNDVMDVVTEPWPCPGWSIDVVQEEHVGAWPVNVDVNLEDANACRRTNGVG